MFDPNRIPKILGWLDISEAQWLYETAQKMQSVLEIGAWCGRSTYCLLEGCKGKVYVIDTFEGSPAEPHWQKFAKEQDVYARFKQNVGHYPNLVTLKGESRKLSKNAPTKVDMVFIDGSHVYEDVKVDIELYGPKAQVLLCGHDYTNPNWPGVAQAVHEAFPPTEVQVKDSIWYVRKNVDGRRGRLQRTEPDQSGLPAEEETADA